MLHKTNGIVLNFIKYSETSIIARIYTEKFGLQSYIINGVRSKSAKSKIALFQPLTILDLVVYYKQQTSIHRIYESSCKSPFKTIPFNQHKLCLAIFIAEVLNKCLKEETGSEEVYQFLENQINELDTINSNFENFHLHFLLNLAHYLGFGPSCVEDMIKREIIATMASEEKIFIECIIKNNTSSSKTTNTIRRKTLSHLLCFYQTHIENFGEINSVEILKEILTS